MADAGSTHSKAPTLPVVMFSKTDLSDLPVVNGPLSMHDAIDTALRNNLSLKVNQYEVKLNKAHVSSESAKLWPTISAFSLTFLIGGNSAFFRAPGLLYPIINFHKVVNQEFGVYARSPILLGGGLYEKLKAEKYQLSAAQELYKVKAIDMAHQVRNTYLEAAYQKEKARLYEHISSTGTAEITVKTEGDVQQKTGYQLLKAKKEFNNSMLELKALLGLNLSSKPILSDALRFHPFGAKARLQTLNQQLAFHPKLRQCEEQLKSARAKVQAAKNGFFPDVFAEASGNFRVPQNPALGFGNGTIAMFATVFPVFDKTVYAKIGTAKVSLEETLEHQQGTQKKLKKEFGQAWNKLMFESRRMQTQYADLIANPPEGIKPELGAHEPMPQFVNAFLSKRFKDTSAQALQLELLQSTFDHEQSVADLLYATGIIYSETE